MNRSREALSKALQAPELLRSFWITLAQNRMSIQADPQMTHELSQGGLKLLSMLYDGTHSCLLRLAEFMATTTTSDEYRALVGPFQTIFASMDLPLAIHIVRPALPKVYEDGGAEEDKTDAEKAREEKALVTETLDGLTIEFVMCFWRFTLYDITFPEEEYTKQLEAKKKQLDEKDKQIDSLDRDHSRRLDRESLRVARYEKEKIKEAIEEITAEKEAHKQHCENVDEHW